MNTTLEKVLKTCSDALPKSFRADKIVKTIAMKKQLELGIDEEGSHVLSFIVAEDLSNEEIIKLSEERGKKVRQRIDNMYLRH